jgi:hypothetical protein
VFVKPLTYKGRLYGEVGGEWGLYETGSREEAIRALGYPCCMALKQGTTTSVTIFSTTLISKLTFSVNSNKVALLVRGTVEQLLRYSVSIPGCFHSEHHGLPAAQNCADHRLRIEDIDSTQLVLKVSL